MAKVKHIAFLQFKDGTTEEQVNQVFSDLLDISENIPGIEDFVCGPNNSPEGLADGFTHALVMTFTDAAARDAYLPHPDHDRFKIIALPLVARICVVDFEL